MSGLDLTKTQTTLADNTEADYEKLAKEGSLVVCPHLLLWPDDLLDMLSGDNSSHTILERIKPGQTPCPCTDIFKSNATAVAHRRSGTCKPRLSSWVKRQQRSVAQVYTVKETITLLIAPPKGSDTTDRSLTEVFTPDRVGSLLQGYIIPVCRHMKLCDPSISQHYATHVGQLLKRKNASDILLPIFNCRNSSCQVVVRFYVYRKELNQPFRTGDAAQLFTGALKVCDVLTLEVSRTFEDLDSLCHPSLLNCLGLPAEQNSRLEDTNKALSHRMQHLNMNRTWYNQAFLDAGYRRLQELVRHLCPDANEHLEMLQTAPRYGLKLNASASGEGESHRPGRSQLSEDTGEADLPPPYRQWV